MLSFGADTVYQSIVKVRVRILGGVEEKVWSLIFFLQSFMSP